MLGHMKLLAALSLALSSAFTAPRAMPSARAASRRFAEDKKKSDMEVAEEFAKFPKPNASGKLSVGMKEKLSSEASANSMGVTDEDNADSISLFSANPIGVVVVAVLAVVAALTLGGFDWTVPSDLTSLQNDLNSLEQ
ncbi:hypothetical protein M885DRAFT_558344 [Pelagophyceae sp. CCMP2097]|nr:hypothetical protein M885DRAFT_558344 [Pelagophyceae sp. CCMP2097]|mmetsp:Transcript_28728/g.99145  ORF Transcript_28728/g.99145 Transcript_28728/m.99145 type:complete len:138 (+) Transcript_28728:2002-2415(+)